MMPESGRADEGRDPHGPRGRPMACEVPREDLGGDDQRRIERDDEVRLRPRGAQIVGQVQGERAVELEEQAPESRDEDEQCHQARRRQDAQEISQQLSQ